VDVSTARPEVRKQGDLGSSQKTFLRLSRLQDPGIFALSKHSLLGRTMPSVGTSIVLQPLSVAVLQL
jgi:hypothetical protein